MQSFRAGTIGALIFLVAAGAFADYPECYLYYSTGDGWTFHYRYYIEGNEVPTGWYWRLDNVANVVDVGTPGGDWQYEYDELNGRWVKWTYVGDPLPAGDYIFQTFDITAVGGAPNDTLPTWSDYNGYTGTIVGPVPEPGSIALMLVGLMGLVGVGLGIRRNSGHKDYSGH